MMIEQYAHARNLVTIPTVRRVTWIENKQHGRNCIYENFLTPLYTLQPWFVAKQTRNGRQL